MGDFDPAIESFARVKNRHGLELFVKLLKVPRAQGNAYLVHGLTDVHDTAHMRALTAACVQSGFNVVVWDSTHSWGRSEGSTDQATFYHHYEDLEDVIGWSREQAWYREQYILAGHSLGGVAAGTYAAAHAEQVAGLVLVSPVVSGARLKRRIPAPIRGLWRWRKVLRVPPGMNQLSYELLESGWAYSLLANAHRLKMPVFIVGAGRDLITPPRFLRRLRRVLSNPASRLVVVRGAKHGFDSSHEMSELVRVVKGWLVTL